jgi:hypothetical protein
MMVVYLAIWSVVIGGALIALIHFSDRKSGHKINLFTEEKDNDEQ